MGCGEMEVELIESDDDGVDMGPSKMTLVECRESLKSIANFIAQGTCLGDKDMLQVQQLANKLLYYKAINNSLRTRFALVNRLCYEDNCIGTL